MSNQMTRTTSADRALPRTARFIPLSLCTFALLPGLAQASQYWCAAGSHQQELAMKVYHQTNYMHPFNSVGLRGIVGNMTIDMPIQCGGGKPGDTFKVYRTTRMQPGMDSQTCQLNQPDGKPIRGIGVRLRSAAGAALRCTDPSPNAHNLVFEVVAASPASTVVGFRVPAALEYIKTEHNTNLAPGLHPLEFPLTNSFVAINSQGTVQEDWGQPYPNAHNSTLVSSCALAQVNTSVQFGKLAIDQLHASERPFSISLKDCASTAAAHLFNSLVSMSFSSSARLPDGTLGNETCDGCAKGVAIEVMNGNGDRVNLTQKYKMSDGTFSITDDTIEQRFRARLISTGSITGGEIKGLLTFVFTSN